MKNKLIINKIRLFLYFLIIPYLKPYNVTLNDTMDTFFKIWKVVSTICLIIIFILKKNKISKRMLYGTIFVITWGISLYCNENILSNRLQELLSIVGLIMLTDIIVLSKKESVEFFKVMYNISVIYIILHLITIILKRPLFGTPLNEYDIYFLGGDNYSAFILLPLCSFLYAHDLIRYKKINIHTIVFSLCGWFCLIYTLSIAGMVAYGIFILLILIRNDSDIYKFISVKKIVVIIVAFLIGVVFFDIHEILRGLLSALGKNGLSSREIIWEKAFDLFFNNFFIGIGSLTQQQIKNYVLYGTDHAHNVVLELLIDTGIIGTTFLTLWIKENLPRKSKKISKGTSCLIKCFIAYLCCSLFDFYIGLIYFYLLIAMIFISENCEETEGDYSEENMYFDS